MTWNNDRVWVGRIGPPDGPHRGWPTYPLGNGPITGRLTIGYVSNVLQDLPLERGKDRPVNRHGEVASLAPEVFVQFGQGGRHDGAGRPVDSDGIAGVPADFDQETVRVIPQADAHYSIIRRGDPDGPYRRVLQLAHRRHADLQIRDWESALIVYHIAPSRGQCRKPRPRSKTIYGRSWAG